jgi:hypothetical protein
MAATPPLSLIETLLPNSMVESLAVRFSGALRVPVQPPAGMSNVETRPQAVTGSESTVVAAPAAQSSPNPMQ